MNAFFWFLAIVFVSWMVFIFIFPLIGRIFLRKLSKKFQNHMENSERKETKPEGSVHIENMPQSSTQTKTEIGDYVNYEEINDNN